MGSLPLLAYTDAGIFYWTLKIELKGSVDKDECRGTRYQSMQGGRILLRGFLLSDPMIRATRLQ
jgi:hypothetical protein